MSVWTYSAFGIHFCATFDIPGPRLRGVGPPTLAVTLQQPSALNLTWSGPAGPPVWSARFDDGRDFFVEQGVAGDYRFSYGSAATFLLSSDRSRLACAPNAGPSVDWMRVLLDSVLFSVALLRGFEALHASAIECEHGVVGFVGCSGAGKTSVAAAFLTRGARLFSDDILAFDPADRGLLVQSGPPLMNLTLEHGGPPIGTKIASFGNEAWTIAHRAAAGPRPLAALFSLRPSASGPLSVTAVNVWEIVPHALSFPHLTGRARGRFALLCDIAERVPLFRLDVPAGCGPAATAGAARRVLDQISAPGALAA